MKRISGLAVFVVFATIPLVAEAADDHQDYKLTFQKEKDGGLSCILASAGVATTAGTDTINITAPKGTVGDVYLSLNGKPASKVTLKEKQKVTSSDVVSSIAIRTKNDPQAAPLCVYPKPQVDDVTTDNGNGDSETKKPTAADAASAALKQSTFAIANPAASAWLTSQHKAPSRDPGAYRRTVHLYHYPDGTLMSPVPNHISEKDEIEINIVYATLGAAQAPLPTIDVTTCDRVPEVRVRSSLSDVLGVIHQRYSGQAKLPDPSQFQYAIYTYPKMLRCANTLSYKVQTVLPNGVTSEATTSIDVEPVYYFSWGAAGVFDFGRTHVLSLATRTSSTGTTEQFVSDVNDAGGFRPVVYIGVHLCGLNPRDWSGSICDWLTPFVGVDATRLTSGFVWGGIISPIPWVGLMLGMSVFQSDVLKDGTGLSVGSVWTSSGDLPKRQVFNSNSVGFLIGLAVSGDALVTLFPGSGK